ncbi:thioesterase II family protein [uncultured Methylobacterium sp.]|uniref:thioesterase II family protein n=1 Tax=uncultured Methylobacterium sp. TaxID=157278 RepID=UPI0035C975B4
MPGPTLTRRPRNRAAPARLVCLPFAGGSASSYAAIEVALAGTAEVATAELPGRGTRFGEPFATDLVGLTAGIADEILALPEKPLVLFGHSMGALLAFEVARTLVDRGSRPAHVVLSGRRPPEAATAEADLTDADLVARMTRLGGTPAEVFARPDLLALVLPVVRADYRLVSGYRPREAAPLPVEATILGGEDDADNPPGLLAGWGRALGGSLNVEIWPGGHFFIRAHEEKLIARLRATFLAATA